MMIIILIIVLSSFKGYSENISVINPSSSDSIMFRLESHKPLEIVMGIANMTPYFKNNPSVSIDKEKNVLINSFTSLLSKYESHQAVKLVDSLLRAPVTGGTATLILLSNIAYYISDNDKLELQKSLPQEFLQYASLFKMNEDAIKNIVRQFDSFYQDSRKELEQYFQKHHTSYERIEKKCNRLIDSSTPSVFRDFFNIKLTQYTLILGLLTPPNKGNYGGKTEKGTVLGFINLNVLEPSLSDNEFGNKNNLRAMSLHEPCHDGIIDPLVYSKYLDDVNKYQSAFLPFLKRQTKPYNSWAMILDEHIVRASVCKMIELLYGQKSSRAELLMQENSYGFSLIQYIFEEFENYQNDREAYPDMDSFFSNFLLSLQGLEPYEASSTPILGIQFENNDTVATILKVYDTYPGAIAGLKEKDRIILCDQIEIHSFKEIVDIVKKKKVGDTLNLVVKRKNEEITISVRLDKGIAYYKFKRG